jgi:hypothetical protein
MRLTSQEYEDLLARKMRQHDEDARATVAARFNQPLEAAVQKAVLEYLNLHPRVAWAVRMNTGAMQIDGRFVKFGFTGCSDVLGQMTDGRFLAVEVKRPGNKPTDEQKGFLLNVLHFGGVAFWCDSVKMCEEKLHEQLG